MELIVFILFIGLMLAGLFASLQKQSEAVDRQKDAINKSERFRQEALEREQRERQKGVSPG